MYAWILGGLSLASWPDVTLIIPYVAVCAVALLAHRRLLDVLRVGEAEAASLGGARGPAAAHGGDRGHAGRGGGGGGQRADRVRGHHRAAHRPADAGPSYRVLLPVSMIGGAAFLVLADIAARTVQAPAEVPIGVITARGGRAVLPVRAAVPAGPAGPVMISLTGVTVRYGSAVALDGVTAQVPAGQWLGLIGPNGAGKTTLLRATAGLLGCEGQISVGGEAIGGLGPRRLARLMAYVPQRPQFPPDMTVSEYVLLGRTAHIGYFRVETAADRRVCAEVIGRMALGPMAGRALRTMSGGELQRVVLARALAQEAPLLLLDEPTSALDLGRRMDALELIDELRRERGLTVVSAIHDLTLAGQFADRLLLLAAGRVAAAGSPAAVLRDDLLAGHFGDGVRVLLTGDGDLAVISRRRARP